jgi:5'-nucleotidase
VPWSPNDVIVHRGPITVGLIGIVTVETPTATLPGNVADLRFLDPVPIIDSIAPALRARGAEVVIVIAHAGGTCTATECHGEIIGVANRLTAKVDAIIAGHSHTRIDAVVHDMPVLEARSRGQALDVIDLDVGPTVKTIRHEVLEIYTDSVKADPDVETIVKRALDRVAPLVNRPVATIADAMRTGGHQYALGNLIADAMRVVGRGDIGIMNNGGIRQSLLAGPATYGSLFEIQPFANNLVRVQVHGSDIRPFFEKALANGTPDFHISGARIVFHAKPTPGIDSITIGGWPIDERRTYTIVESDFMAAGGDNLGWGATAVATESAQVTDLDALIAYLRSLPQPVTAPSAQRIIGP